VIGAICCVKGNIQIVIWIMGKKWNCSFFWFVEKHTTSKNGIYKMWQLPLVLMEDR
jgi:hypothetical protein